MSGGGPIYDNLGDQATPCVRQDSLGPVTRLGRTLVEGGKRKRTYKRSLDFAFRPQWVKSGEGYNFPSLFKRALTTPVIRLGPKYMNDLPVYPESGFRDSSKDWTGLITNPRFPEYEKFRRIK